MISILVYIAFFLGLIEVFKFPFLIAKKIKIKMNKGERESKIGFFRSDFGNNRRNNGDGDNRTSDSGRDGRDSYCESNGTGDNYRMVDIFDNNDDSNTTN